MQRTEEKKLVGRRKELIGAVSLSWSELCSDLLGDIMGRLCLTDQARFHAVCKSWRHACPVNKSHAVFKPGGLESASLFSWFLCVVDKIRQPNRTLEFHLYEPCYSIHNPISAHTISLSELGIPNLSSSTCIRIFCKHNWLFISFTNREQGGNCAQIYFILFSPLTKTLKQLPPCSSDSPLWNFQQSFSSDPESADCVFLLLNTWPSYIDEFIVATYRKDDENWTVRQFTEVRIFYESMCKPIYTGGIFDIVSPCGQVVSYDVIKEEINFESLFMDDDLAGNYINGGTHDLFTIKGELMYTFCYDDDISCTKRFDRSSKVWIPVSSYLQDLATIANEKPRSVANTIEFVDSGCLICSLESFVLDQLAPKSPRFIFRDRPKSDYFFWLNPPLPSFSET